MDLEFLRNLLIKFKEGEKNVNEVIDEIKKLFYEDTGFAKIDHSRELRKGFPEVVFCERKELNEALEIILKLSEKSKRVLATRASKELYEKVKEKLDVAQFNEKGRTISIIKEEIIPKGLVSILTAGTSDIPVAEEVYETLKIMGAKTQKIYDIGVAGIHRLFDNLEKIRESKVVIVVAGMDGVLPSVVGGLIDKPVIAVPTSVGYGVNFNGVAPLLTMLNSCAPGVAVVNIDNGFGAGFIAGLINKIGEEE
ncbi:MAG: nickel pincer cofactor biosynthesis protein LarB [Caldisericia bacterium]|nr:nickel pincer cofactor biosynthesis protein LarB [Caldisericia bacterium]